MKQRQDVYIPRCEEELFVQGSQSDFMVDLLSGLGATEGGTVKLDCVYDNAFGDLPEEFFGGEYEH